MSQVVDEARSYLIGYLVQHFNEFEFKEQMEQYLLLLSDLLMLNPNKTNL